MVVGVLGVAGMADEEDEEEKGLAEASLATMGDDVAGDDDDPVLLENGRFEGAE